MIQELKCQISTQTGNIFIQVSEFTICVFGARIYVNYRCNGNDKPEKKGKPVNILKCIKYYSTE